MPLNARTRSIVMLIDAIVVPFVCARCEENQSRPVLMAAV